MKRHVVVALVAILGSEAAGPLAFAEGPLAQAAARAVQTQVTTSGPADGAVTPAPRPAASAPLVRPAYSAGEQAPPVLSSSGLRKRTKIMLLSSLAAGFVASAWAIDRRVQDITPSSLGSRED